MAAESRTTLKTYFETGDTPTQAQFANLIDSFYSLVSDFKILFGTINQSGTNAPVLTIFLNSTGFTPSFSYTGVGQYLMTSAGNLDVAKVITFIGTGQASRYTPNIFSDTSPDSFEIGTLDNAASPDNDLLDATPFLMIVIP